MHRKATLDHRLQQPRERKRWKKDPLHEGTGRSKTLRAVIRQNPEDLVPGRPRP